MPQRLYTAAEQNLIDALKLYWENHRFFFTTSFDCLNLMDTYRAHKFQNEKYIGAMALKVAQAVCASSDAEWVKFLQKHGMYGGFALLDTSENIPIVFNAICQVNPSSNQDATLRQAVVMARDLRHSDLVKNRLGLINEYSHARLKPVLPRNTQP